MIKMTLKMQKGSCECEDPEERDYLEPGALPSTGLLLHRHNLQHLILQRGAQEEINDLRLLQKSGTEHTEILASWNGLD